MNTIPFDLIQLLATDTNKFVKEYLQLPPLPYGKTIKIDKIACFNYNPFISKEEGRLTYYPFTVQCPEEFPKCRDPEKEYEDTDQVTPVVIISGDLKYRVKQLLWIALRDVSSKIQMKQNMLQRKLLPIEVFIDNKDQFMVKLLNLAMG